MTVQFFEWIGVCLYIHTHTHIYIYTYIYKCAIGSALRKAEVKRFRGYGVGLSHSLVMSRLLYRMLRTASGSGCGKMMLEF